MNRGLIGLSMLLLFFGIVSHVQAESEKTVQISIDDVVLEFVWVPKGCFHYKNSGKTPHNIGTKSANGLGIYDMSGNVWEWCNDWYDSDYYKTSPVNNPAGPTSGSERVTRGGAWRELDRYSKTTTRTKYTPSKNSNNLGFRLVFAP